MMKLPNPRRNTSFPAIIDSLTLSMNASTTVVATDFSIPVSCAIRAIISAFVRLFYYKIRCKDNNISLCRLDCQPDNVTENDNPPLSHGVPSARTRQSESLNENRKHIALILKKIHFNPANTKAHCPSFGLRLPNGPLNFPLLSFTPCRLSTLNTELRLLYPLTAMMSSKE